MSSTASSQIPNILDISSRLSPNATILVAITLSIFFWFFKQFRATHFSGVTCGIQYYYVN